VSLRTPFPHCPLCGAPPGRPFARADCTSWPHYAPPLPPTLTWLRCDGCGHIHTDGYWTAEGLALVLARAHASQVAGGDLDQKRVLWAPVVQAVAARLEPPEALFEGRRSWLDVGCGDGALVMTAAEFGFDAAGLDARRETVEKLAALGYKALHGDFLSAGPGGAYDVVSLADVLEHLPYPRVALERASALLKPGGALFVSCPNLESASWRAMDAARANPYWIEMEHCHNFSRRLLTALLRKCALKPVHYGVNQRYKCGMDLIALKPGLS
jgi:SAM-dependent methyltransferase